MALSLSDLIKPLTKDQAKSTILVIAQQLGLSTETWAEGGITRTIIAIMATLLATFSEILALVAKGGFLDLAEEGWLTLLAHNVYRVDRLEAVAAKGQILLTNHGGGRYVIDPGDLTFAHASSHKTYRNTTGGTLDPGDGQTLTLDIQAEEDGPDSSASTATITVMVTTLLGVTCSNAVALVGLAEESDPDLRQRCRDSLALLSPAGPRAAYVFVAKSARDTDGTPLGITRVKLMPATGDGNADLFIAKASGHASDHEVSIVQAQEDLLVTPYGFTTTVKTTTDITVTAPLTIWIADTVADEDATVRTAINGAIRDYVGAVPIGGYVISPAVGKLYWRGIAGVAEGVYQGQAIKVQLDTEADITIDVGGVPIWQGVDGDVSVVRVAA